VEQCGPDSNRHDHTTAEALYAHRESNPDHIVWYGMRDSNPRPLGPKPSALPDRANPMNLVPRMAGATPYCAGTGSRNCSLAGRFRDGVRAGISYSQAPPLPQRYRLLCCPKTSWPTTAEIMTQSSCLPVLLPTCLPARTRRPFLFRPTAQCGPDLNRLSPAAALDPLYKHGAYTGDPAGIQPARALFGMG
jgi:hypothetical protein